MCPIYKRNAQGWSKHFDFLVLDELSLQLAFILAGAIRRYNWVYAAPLYRSIGFLYFLIDALVLVLNNTMHNVMHRDIYAEAVATFKHCFYVFALATIYVFASQSGDVYSRILISLTFFLHLLLSFLSRLFWKAFLRRLGKTRMKKNSMLVFTTPESAVEILSRLSSDEVTDYKIEGVILTEPTDLKEIGGYPIVADMDSSADYIVRNRVDSVYIDAPMTDEKVVKLMDACTRMGVPTHYHVPNMSCSGVKRFSEKIGGTTVLTTSINYATPLQLIIKRLFDIFAGLIGSLAALLIIAIVGPIIRHKSPGPVLFTQERVGHNGKRFEMYKIRSMHMDAEERKKELMEQNRVKDGMMFKLDFDSRIIGNEILPDGTKNTGIGEFIRKTSLDEFPQFFNVLEGSMSVVGVRPPTVDEWEKYEYHHRARLAIKPGITGLWQVSGRSEITDFEEVVRLDTQYITNWSLSLDLKILLQTVGVLFTKKGAM